MKTGWWKLKDTDKLDPLKCLVFPKYNDTHYERNELDESGEIDLELFEEIVESTIKLNDMDRQHIVELIRQGCYSGQVVQE